MTSPALTPGVGVDVASLATRVFDAVVEHFTEAGVHLPDRRFMAPGAPEQIAWDTEMLVMTLSGIGIGAAPGQAAPRQGHTFGATVLRHVVLTFQLVRCEPKPTNGGRAAPTVKALNAAAHDLFRDAGLMSHSLTRAATAISRELPGAMVDAGAVAPVGPEGGYVGLQTSITLTAANLV